MGSLLEAGVHPADVVFYREGQGPKLCASLEESISQILAEDTQFLEDMEGRTSFQFHMYVSRCRRGVVRSVCCARR